jgi:hypothetical protein
MMLTSNTNPMGDLNSFSVAVDPSTPTCQVGQMTSIPAGVTCKYIATFSPKGPAGVTSQVDALMISDGEMLTFTMTGKGLAGWVKETVNLSGGIQAAYAASATDLYIVGKDIANTGQGVQHSGGDGKWQSCTSLMASLNNVFSIGGGNGFVYVGTDAGAIWWSPTGATTCSWKQANTSNSGWPTTAAIVGMGFDAIAGNVWAVSDGGVVAVSPAAAGNFTNQAFPASPAPLVNRLFVPTQGQPVWVGQQGTTGFVAGISPAGGPQNYAVPAVATALRGVWGGAAGFWVVGDNSIILRYTFNVTATPNMEPLPNGLTGPIYSVSGRTDPNGNVMELYAAGLLGNVVLQSTGNGTWNAVPLPDNSGSIAVAESPTGEVIVGQLTPAGQPGVVCHYY